VRDPRIHRRPVRLDGQGRRHHDEARETLVITRKTSERLFEFSFRLAERRKARGKPGR
jgi:3-isopropylmalate dehydrogenase